MPKTALTAIPLEALVDELKRRTALMEKLKGRQARLQSELKAIAGRIAALENPALAGIPPSAGLVKTAAPVVGKLTLADEVAQVMSGRKSMRAEDVVTAIEKTRRTKPPKYFRSMVYVALKSEKRFRRIRRGLYALR
jgi:hypothetical protein